jgi:hypothetical protein
MGKKYSVRVSEKQGYADFRMRRSERRESMLVVFATTDALFSLTRVTLLTALEEREADKTGT